MHCDLHSSCNLLGLLEVHVFLRQQPFAYSVIADPTHKAMPESNLQMIAALTMADKTAECRSVMRDRLSASLVPLVEPIAFRDDQRFWRNMSLESSAELVVGLVCWLLRGKQVLQKLERCASDDGQKHLPLSVVPQFHELG